MITAVKTATVLIRVITVITAPGMLTGVVTVTEMMQATTVVMEEVMVAVMVAVMAAVMAAETDSLASIN
ncbi:hypothetical protein UF13_10795 [Pantoea agglomerans]|nr:hypothetical protein UF13_10795 [Pantoea agglomerans]